LLLRFSGQKAWPDNRTRHMVWWRLSFPCLPFLIWSDCNQSMHLGRKALRTPLLSQLFDQCMVKRRDPLDSACWGMCSRHILFVRLYFSWGL
jgi:hypothetical protein